jgi:spore germination protein GerM
MDQKKILIAGFLALLLVILVVIFFTSGGNEKIKQSRELTPPELKTQPEVPGEKKKIALFFLSEDDDLLHPEERDIQAKASTEEEASEAIEELIKGSQSALVSPLPPETKLRQIFLTKEGMAYVDFSKEIQDKSLSGSEAEMAAVYSIVNSLTYNFKSIKKVLILVDGEEAETLAGHINLSKPFAPDYSLIAQE